MHTRALPTCLHFLRHPPHSAQRMQQGQQTHSDAEALLAEEGSRDGTMPPRKKASTAASPSPSSSSNYMHLDFLERPLKFRPAGSPAGTWPHTPW